MMMHPAMNMVIDHVPESGAQSITGSPWVALDTQHSSATLERAHLPRGKPGHPTPSRGAGKASPAAPVLRSCGSRDPRQFVTRGPKSTMRQIPNRCHGECSYPQPPPVRHVKTAGILAAVAVTEPAAGTPPPAGTYGAPG